MSEQNLEVARGMYESFGRGDVPTVLGTMAEDVEWRPADSIPYGDPKPVRGPQEVAERVFGPLTTDVEGFTVTPEEFVVSGDTVVAIGRYGGVGQKTGKRLDTTFAHVLKFENGKVIRFVQFTDTAKFLEVVPADVATRPQAAGAA